MAPGLATVPVSCCDVSLRDARPRRAARRRDPRPYPFSALVSASCIAGGRRAVEDGRVACAAERAIGALGRGLEHHFEFLGRAILRLADEIELVSLAVDRRRLHRAGDAVEGLGKIAPASRASAARPSSASPRRRDRLGFSSTSNRKGRFLRVGGAGDQAEGEERSDSHGSLSDRIWALRARERRRFEMSAAQKALNVMIVRVSTMPGMICTFWPTKWPMSTSRST